MIGFHIGFDFMRFGSADYLHAFFSNIGYHLESDGWGSKYPYLLKRLYQGELNAEDAPCALEELREVRSRFLEIDPSKVIWDIYDLSKQPQPPWDQKMPVEVTSLENYFRSVSGFNIFDLLELILEESSQLKRKVIIGKFYLPI